MSIGSQSQIIFDANATVYSGFDGNSVAMPFVSESIKQVSRVIRDQQMRGTRQRTGDRNVDDAVAYRGSIVLQPTKVELDTLLPYILGTAESSDAFAIAETLPEFSIMLNRDRWLYVLTGCKVDVATFRSSRTSPLLELEMAIEARTQIKSSSETVPGTVPAYDTGNPWRHYDSTLTLYGGGVAVDELSLVINNFLTKDRFYNSATQKELLPTDQLITLSGMVPVDSTTDGIANAAASSETGGSLVYNDSVNTLTFTMGHVSMDPDNENADTKEEIKRRFSAEIQATGSTASLAVTNAVNS